MGRCRRFVDILHRSGERSSNCKDDMCKRIRRCKEGRGGCNTGMLEVPVPVLELEQVCSCRMLVLRRVWLSM